MRSHSLNDYHRKRDFKASPEPRGQRPSKKAGKKLSFVVQEHHASHLHYDFRLELDGVLRSWAIPKGPSLDPKVKRLAVEVEDHPLSYGKFEGTIPAHQYGAGEVFIWDNGNWTPHGDPRASLKKGRLEFSLSGHRLKGDWILVRTGKPQPKKKPVWLLIKRAHDAQIASTQMPDFISPQLALLVDRVPSGEGWIHEVKFDGYRIQAHLQSKNIKLFTRSGLNWTAKYPELKNALSKLKVENAIFDGEVVALDKTGRSDFGLLQRAMKDKKSKDLVYYVFDLLFLNGTDLRGQPLEDRKKRLAKILSSLKGGNVFLSTHLQSQGREFFDASCDHHLEGIISKRVDRPYLSGRRDDWVKTKCRKGQEFVIGGYVEGQGHRQALGALLLGVFDAKEDFVYVGRVGSGFDTRDLKDLLRRLKKIEQEASAFDQKSPRGTGLHWVNPQLVAQIEFSNWTKDGVLRNPVFHGLRLDKPAGSVRKEQPKGKVNFTHPKKIIFHLEKITKAEVGAYYEKVSDWILPHLFHRPLSLNRCPNGPSQSCFFQKHVDDGSHEHLLSLQVKEKSAVRNYVMIDSIQGLLELVQMGAFEIHTWNCHSETMQSPDQIVMDFDPGPGVSWSQVKNAALELREIFDHLKLRSFVKLSGGKGLHVHVPFEPLYDWDQVKGFAQAIALEMASRDPQLYTAKISKHQRRGRIFVDYLRNGYGATAVAPYVLRAREPSSVALPISWEDLRKIKSPSVFTLQKTLAYLAKQKTDPWRDYFKVKQKITILG